MQMSFGRGVGAQHGMTGSGIGRALRGQGKKPPELMDPTRQRDMQRILALFRPYRWRLAAVLVLIAISAGASIVNPFLIRDAIDVGLFRHDTTVLTETVLGMIGIAIFSNATSVWQTYMSNVVGQRVMHDLRAAVYHHLQRMSLAFFTRTRTGEVQSRIANDIGGLDCVLTTTATTIAQNATTVIAALVAMLHPRLAARAAFARVRAAVGLPDPPGRPRPPADHDRAAAAAGRHVARSSPSRCRCPGSCSARRWAAARTSPIASPANRRASPTSRSARGWRAAG